MLKEKFSRISSQIYILLILLLIQKCCLVKLFARSHARKNFSHDKFIIYK